MEQNHLIQKERPRTSMQQRRMLVEFLEANRCLTSPLSSKVGPFMRHRLWQKCAKMLNIAGPPKRPQEWSKIWSDTKCKLKGKLWKLQQIKRGQLPKDHKIRFSPLDLRMARLIGLPNEIIPEEVSKAMLPENGDGIQDSIREARPEPEIGDTFLKLVQLEEGYSSKDENSNSDNDDDDDDEQCPASSVCAQLDNSQNDDEHDKNNKLLIEKEYQDRKKRTDELHRLKVLLLKERLREAKAKSELAELELAQKRKIHHENHRDFQVTIESMDD